MHLQNPEHLKYMLITNSTQFSKPNFVEKVVDFKIKGKTLFSVNGKEHAMHRRLLNPSFSYGSVQTYIPIFNKIADNLIEVGFYGYLQQALFSFHSTKPRKSAPGVKLYSYYLRPN